MKDNYTKNALAALRAAKSASKKANQNYVGTEHLLIALISDTDSYAVRFLGRIGKTVRNSIRNIQLF